MMPASLGRVELERQHPGARDAGGDDAREILVGDRVAELAAAQIDAADAVAVRAVAGRALRVVEARAVGDVGRRVFAGMRGLILRRQTTAGTARVTPSIARNTLRLIVFTSHRARAVGPPRAATEASDFVRASTGIRC